MYHHLTNLHWLIGQSRNAPDLSPKIECSIWPSNIGEPSVWPRICSWQEGEATLEDFDEQIRHGTITLTDVLNGICRVAIRVYHYLTRLCSQRFVVLEYWRWPGRRFNRGLRGLVL